MELTDVEMKTWREMASRTVRNILPPAFPKIVCLCGSTRFKDQYLAAQRSETLAGRIVFSVGLFGHEECLDMGGEVKERLDRLHFEKILISDEILVLNVGGYIGYSTRREINYAASLGKTIRYLEQP